MASLALEEGETEPVFEQFDLIAHRGLGHAQGLTRAGEIAQTRRSLEDADRVNRRKVGAHSHKSALSKAIENALVKERSSGYVFAVFMTEAAMTLVEFMIGHSPAPHHRRPA